MAFFHRFKHTFLKVCCDRRFYSPTKICNKIVKNEGWGGVKGRLNDVKKRDDLVDGSSSLCQVDCNICFQRRMYRAQICGLFVVTPELILLSQ